MHSCLVGMCSFFLFGERNCFYSLWESSWIHSNYIPQPHPEDEESTRLLRLIVRMKITTAVWTPHPHPLSYLHLQQALEYLSIDLVFPAGEPTGLALICRFQDVIGSCLCSFLPGMAVSFHYLWSPFCSPFGPIWTDDCILFSHISFFSDRIACPSCLPLTSVLSISWLLSWFFNLLRLFIGLMCLSVVISEFF